MSTLFSQIWRKKDWDRFFKSYLFLHKKDRYIWKERKKNEILLASISRHCKYFLYSNLYKIHLYI